MGYRWLYDTSKLSFYLLLVVSSTALSLIIYMSQWISFIPNQSILPNRTGVYCIYVGTKLVRIGVSRNLASRVSSYFSNSIGTIYIKEATLIKLRYKDSYNRALLLESFLITRLKPTLNKREEIHWPVWKLVLKGCLEQGIPKPDLSVIFEKAVQASKLSLT